MRTLNLLETQNVAGASGDLWMCYAKYSERDVEEAEYFANVISPIAGLVLGSATALLSKSPQAGLLVGCAVAGMGFIFGQAEANNAQLNIGNYKY